MCYAYCIWAPSVLGSSVPADISLILWSDGHTHPVIFPSCISENWSLFWFVCIFFSVLFIACHLNDKKEITFFIVVSFARFPLIFACHKAEVSIHQLLLFLWGSYAYQQILQLFPCSCMRDLSESCAYMHALEGMIQNAQENILQKSSVWIPNAFLLHFDCSTVEKVCFVLAGHVLPNGARSLPQIYLCTKGVLYTGGAELN